MAESGGSGSTGSSAAAGEYGGFWIRFFAYLTDAAILLIATVVVTVAIFFGVGMDGMTIGSIVITLGTLLYWPVMQASARQATFGKALLGLKVTGADGERISFLRSLGRELGKIVSTIPMMLGFVLAGLHGRKQALHDMIASTYVVREGPRHLVVALAISFFGLVTPLIVIMLLGGTVLMALVGGAGLALMSGMMDDARKQMKPVPEMRQPAEQPRTRMPSTETAVQKPAANAPAPTPAAKPEAVASAAPPAPSAAAGPATEKPAAGAARAQGLTDPTRPPSAAAGSPGAQQDAPATQLQSVLLSPQRKLAVINGEIVALGGMVGEAQVVRITETEVVLKKGNETEVLKMFPGIEKRSSKRGSSK